MKNNYCHKREKLRETFVNFFASIFNILLEDDCIVYASAFNLTIK